MDYCFFFFFLLNVHLLRGQGAQGLFWRGAAARDPRCSISLGFSLVWKGWYSPAITQTHPGVPYSDHQKNIYILFKNNSEKKIKKIKKIKNNSVLLGTWVAQWLCVCLWLRSWSWGPGIESCIRFPTRGLFFPVPMPLLLSLSVSLMNKQIKSFKKKKDTLIS